MGSGSELSGLRVRGSGSAHPEGSGLGLAELSGDGIPEGGRGQGEGVEMVRLWDGEG